MYVICDCDLQFCSHTILMVMLSCVRFAAAICGRHAVPAIFNESLSTALGLATFTYLFIPFICTCLVSKFPKFNVESIRTHICFPQFLKVIVMYCGQQFTGLVCTYAYYQYILFTLPSKD